METCACGSGHELGAGRMIDSLKAVSEEWTSKRIRRQQEGGVPVKDKVGPVFAVRAERSFKDPQSGLGQWDRQVKPGAFLRGRRRGCARSAHPPADLFRTGQPAHPSGSVGLDSPPMTGVAQAVPLPGETEQHQRPLWDLLGFGFCPVLNTTLFRLRPSVIRIAPSTKVPASCILRPENEDRLVL